MKKTVKIKLTIAYDGENYEGWQVQKVGRGVQQVIEEAFAEIFHEQFRVHSSSRTDTGVHARGMVAHVEISKAKLKMPLRKLPLAINSKLPEDVRVMEARKAPSDFQARFDAKGKQYRYYLYNFPVMDPLLRKQAWHVPQSLDFTSMQAATKHFVGKKDFAAFANNRNYKMESTVRTLHRCDLSRKGPLLTFTIEGDGFLYKMCRGIVGTVVQVGLGKFAPSQILKMLEAKDRRMAGMTAPAHGLVLWKVFY